MKFNLDTPKLEPRRSRYKLIIGVILFISMVAFFIAQTPTTFALTEIEYCETLSDQAVNTPPFHLKSPKQQCIDDLNTKAWNTCISNPSPGDCADNIRNSERVESTVPDTITNKERKDIANCSDVNTCLPKNPIIKWSIVLVNFLSAGVIVAVTISVVIGGIQYSAAGSNPQAVAAAKKRIINALIALVLYIFLYSFVDYLIPGGLL